MVADIFDFWANCPNDATIHPADAKVFGRVEHGFQTECLPIPYSGPLRTAPVVLLFLSPGFHPFDLEIAETEAGRAWYRGQRGGFDPLASAAEHEPACEWWSKIVRQFGVKPAAVRDKVAVLNIGAYHSKSFRDWHMPTALPSSRVALSWAQGVIFSEADAGKRIVVCLRSAKLWGLRKGECNGGSLYAPKHGRSGIMNKGPLRDEISAKVRERIG